MRHFGASGVPAGATAAVAVRRIPGWSSDGQSLEAAGQPLHERLEGRDTSEPQRVSRALPVSEYLPPSITMFSNRDASGPIC